eukprot:PhF_6_TR16572/c0_g1_i1/m.25259
MLRRFTVGKFRISAQPQSFQHSASRRWYSDPSKSTSSTTTATDTTKKNFRHMGFKQLIKEYGLPLAVYYLALNETCVIGITCGLHYGYFGGADVISTLNKIGLASYIDLNKLSSSSMTIGPIEISARLMSNFGLATAFMSLWTPLQIPFCIATLPMLKRLLGRKRNPLVR